MGTFIGGNIEYKPKYVPKHSSLHMDPEQEKIEKFMRTMLQVVPTCPLVPSAEVKKLRMALITEELHELDDAFTNDNLVGIADALADLIYVVKGTAAACGIDIEPIFNEVHKSNMTKVGGVVREDGKILKPENYEPPRIKNLLKLQTCDTCELHLKNEQYYE